MIKFYGFKNGVLCFIGKDDSVIGAESNKVNGFFIFPVRQRTLILIDLGFRYMLPAVFFCRVKDFLNGQVGSLFHVQCFIHPAALRFDFGKNALGFPFKCGNIYRRIVM